MEIAFESVVRANRELMDYEEILSGVIEFNKITFSVSHKLTNVNSRMKMTIDKISLNG